MLDKLAEHVFGFGGGAILTGFVVLFDGRQNTLNRVAIRCVPANFEFASQLVQETGGGNNRQAVICYRNFVAPQHTAWGAICSPEVCDAKTALKAFAVAATDGLCPFVMNLIAIF